MCSGGEARLYYRYLEEEKEQVNYRRIRFRRQPTKSQS